MFSLGINVISKPSDLIKRNISFKVGRELDASSRATRHELDLKKKKMSFRVVRELDASGKTIQHETNLLQP